ncbi:WD40 repeat domain-containing protein [Fimbriiglobus ruber]|uniref:High-affnity carbon uptake protein Hat/HatR n=1 Tax=Fimbriiglobus ruber TaxID=1908690 RepID=A0A225D4N5_9BACT|nr:WD40 repeat domain-containing protein [Fimbriiglobus ruber]OWK36540.1 High-affnity carbon uptake protein Hat/HatR [Fimbriiglobus ruber]
MSGWRYGTRGIVFVVVLLCSCHAAEMQKEWDGLAGSHPVTGKTMRNFDRVSSVSYSPDGSRLLIAGIRTGRGRHPDWALVYAAATFEELASLPPTKADDRNFLSSADRVISDPQGRVIITAGVQVQETPGAPQYFHELKVWDAKTFKLLWTHPSGPGRDEAFNDAAVSPDGTTLVAVTNSLGFADQPGAETVWVWDLKTWRLRTRFHGHHATMRSPGQPPYLGSTSVCSVAFAPDGRTLATCGYENRIRFWDAANEFRELDGLDGHTGAVMRLAYYPDGSRLVSASYDGTAIIWDLKTRKPAHTLKLKNVSQWKVDVAVSPDGKTIATADNVEVRLWDTATGEALETLALPYPEASCVAFSPDGKYLAVGFDDLFPKKRGGGSDGVIQWVLADHKLREPSK